MRLRVLVVCVFAFVGAGCFDQPPPQIGPGCPDGDCAPPPACGDGACNGDETCGTCAADCGRCPLPCAATDLAAKPSVDVHGSTVGALAALDDASCGDGASAPAVTYVWYAPASGRYRVTATGAFAIVLDARDGVCGGPDLACGSGANGASIEVPLWQGAPLTITVTGAAGASGDFELTITRAPDQCGDDLCGPSEDCSSCASDCGACPPPAYCGDGVCNAGEDCSSCAYDCGACPPPSYCGDGVCDAGEDCNNCDWDCGSCPVSSYCGDGTCDAGEDCGSCEWDCGSCPVSSYCGDGTCDADEDCGSCAADCGDCMSYCGDGTCDADEDCSWCDDCGSC